MSHGTLDSVFESIYVLMSFFLSFSVQNTNNHLSVYIYLITGSVVYALHDIQVSEHAFGA